MALLNPSALVLLGLIPLLLLLYFRRHPRRVHRVSSILLWHPAGERSGRRAWLRRIRHHPLLLLQLLFLAAGIAALARPVLQTGSGVRDIVFVFDSSASMATTEAGVSRFALARRRALEILDSLARGDRVQLIQAASRARVVCDFSADRRRLRRLIVALEPFEAGADVDEALLLALAATEEGGRVYFFGDRAKNAAINPGLELDRVRFVQVGKSSNNVGITRFGIRTSRLSPFDHDLFTEVANFSKTRRKTILGIWAGERRLWHRSMVLDAGERQSIVAEDLFVSGLDLRASLGVEDDLEVDDQAYALVKPPARIRVLLLTDGNFFLEEALRVHPSVDLAVLPPEAYPQAVAEAGDSLIVFDGFEPAPPGPERALVVLHPGVAGARISGEIEVRGRDHPLMSSVDVSGISIAAGAAVEVPPGGRVLLAASGEPILVASDRHQLRRAVLGFDLRASNWPLTLSFPVFVANAVRWLSPAEDANRVQWAAGETLDWSVATAHGLSALTVEDPTGAARVVPVAAGRLIYEQTSRTGIYTVSGDNVKKFVVNLVNASESDIEPLAAGTGSGRPLAGDRETRPHPPGGLEVSRYLILSALLILALEWLLYCRSPQRPATGAIR